MEISNLTEKRLKDVKQSAILDHLLECNFAINFDDFSILATDCNKFKLLPKESLKAQLTWNKWRSWKIVWCNQLYLNIVTICYVPRTSGNWPLRHITNFRELWQTFHEIMILHHVYSNRVWIERAEFSVKLHNKVFV